MVKSRDQTRKVCKYCHAVVKQRLEHREFAIKCPYCKREISKDEVTTARRHKGMPRGVWIP